MNYSDLFDLIRYGYTKFSYNNRYGKALIPLRYFLELTYRCNLSCPYCYVGEERNKKELTTDEWKKVIDKCRKNYIPQLTFTGGEPTIRKDLIELIDYSKWFITRLNTNGVLLTKELCKNL